MLGGLAREKEKLILFGRSVLMICQTSLPFIRTPHLLYHSTLGLRVMEKKTPHLEPPRAPRSEVNRGTSLTRKRNPLAPYRRPMPRALWRS